MILTLGQWKEILDAVNSNDDILEQIKVKLQDQFKGVYEKWKQDRFDVKHLFNISWTINDEQFDQESTLLHIAAYNGQLKIVKYLIEKGADVNAVEKDKWTALHLATKNGHLKMVKHLIEKGIEINSTNGNGSTALHMAAQYGCFPTVKHLVKKGADVNVLDKYDNNPFHLAFQYDHYEIAEYLKGTGTYKYTESCAWHKVPWTKPKSLVKNDFAQFIGFFTAHMVWMLNCIGPDEENVVPLIAIQNADKCVFRRVGGDDLPYECAVAIAREQLQSILSSSRGDYVLLAYDGFFTQNNKRDESLFIEAYDIRDPEGITLVFAIPYRSAQSKEGLAIYRPVVIETANLSDINTFLNHAYEGAQSHTNGFEFWEAHIDISCKEEL